MWLQGIALDQNDLVALLMAVMVLAGALARRSRIAGNSHRAVGWWIGTLHGLMFVLTVHAATMAHDLPFRAAMITFAAYAAAMTASETLVLLKHEESA